MLYSLIAMAKRHGLDPFAYLRDVIARISDHPHHRLGKPLADHPGTAGVRLRRAPPRRVPRPAGWKLGPSVV